MSDYIRGKKLTDIESKLLNILEELRALDRADEFNNCIEPFEPLKPCPCCGSYAYYCEDIHHNYYVKCSGCGLVAISDGSAEAVKRIWNRRV